MSVIDTLKKIQGLQCTMTNFCGSRVSRLVLVLIVVLLLSVAMFLYYGRDYSNWYDLFTNQSNRNRVSDIDEVDPGKNMDKMTSKEGETVTVKLGEKFTLKEGQVAVFETDDVYIKVKVKEFINSQCPDDAQCVWSGQMVLLEVSDADGGVLEKRILGPLYNYAEVVNTKNYTVYLIDSDFQSYVVMNLVYAGNQDMQ